MVIWEGRGESVGPERGEGRDWKKHAKLWQGPKAHVGNLLLLEHASKTIQSLSSQAHSVAVCETRQKKIAGMLFNFPLLSMILPVILYGMDFITIKERAG